MLSLTFSLCSKDAAGIAGNIFALGLFLSPMEVALLARSVYTLLIPTEYLNPGLWKTVTSNTIPTFRRIIRNQSTEHFSGLPYVYSLLNCLICAWYGTPLVSSDNLLVTSVNSVGAAFQITYIVLFMIYAEAARKLRMLGLLLAIFGLFAIIVIGSLLTVDIAVRHDVIGFLSCASLISMFASPLFIINLVIRTRSVEFMPFSLSLSTFLMSTSFMLYGIFNSDPFIYTPNGIGTILGTIQLVLFCYYKNIAGEGSREPLIESYSE